MLLSTHVDLRLMSLPGQNAAKPVRESQRVLWAIFYFDDIGSWVECLYRCGFRSEEDLSTRLGNPDTRSKSTMPITHKAVLNILSEGVIVTDQHGDIVEVNPAAVRMHGWSSREEALGELRDVAADFQVRTLGGEVARYEEYPIFRILAGESFSNLELV